MDYRLTEAQEQIVRFPREGGASLCVVGPASCGKSTALRARLAALLCEGTRPHEILVLLPQRAQVALYEQALSTLEAPTRGGCDLITFYGLTRRAVALFWPLVAEAGGFAHPDREPTFLTIETTQFYMWRIVEPLLAHEGYFSDLTIRRERLLSQLIDNLNKSAVVGFDHSDIARRLRNAWTGEAQRLASYVQAQDCASRFRRHCLDHNLLDFSLVTEVFTQHLLSHPVFAQFFDEHYAHLMVDDLEENVPAAHRFIRWAMPRCASTVLSHDAQGGYRIFLGADATGAAELCAETDERLTLDRPLDGDPGPRALAQAARNTLRLTSEPPAVSPHEGIAGQSGHSYWIEMIHWTAEEVARRVADGTPANEIAIIAPYVSEVMRFALQEALRAAELDIYLLRPSSPLIHDPIARGMLSLALLAHPDWTLTIQDVPLSLASEDVALALENVIDDLDPVRAQILAAAALPPGGDQLLSLEQLALRHPRLWSRVGYRIRPHYGDLVAWIERYRQEAPQPLDLWLNRLFGELLTGPGFAFHRRPDRARSYARLVESAAKFTQALQRDEALAEAPIGREYVEMLLSGLASASYVADWPLAVPENAVVLAPAQSYLTRDMRSDYQFWIDLGSIGWWTRPNQPLTNPYVLARTWQPGQPWRDIEEQQASREALGRVLQGLASRCRKGVYLGHCELGLDGSEQQGRLHRIIMAAMAQGGARHAR